DVANIDREVGLSRHTGGFLFIQVEEPPKSDKGEGNGVAKVLLREKRRPQFARATMQVDSSQAAYPVTRFELGPIVTPIKYAPEERKKEFEKALTPLTPEMKHKVVGELCDSVRKRYVFPEIGDEIILQLQANERDGAYREPTESEE